MFSKIFKFFAFAGMTTLAFSSCQKSQLAQPEATAPQMTAAARIATSTCATPYTIALESITPVGSNYEWVWSVTNPNPGNGNNGTIQNLSHWDITLGTCATFADIVAGYMSTDGINWTAFTPTYQQDMSIWNTASINTGNVVKFDMGTSGSATSYYKLVISKNLDVDMNVTAYYKSGNTTGSGTQCFPGFGCPIVVSEGCSFSQGYWFAKPNLVWPGTLTLGGKTYTQAEGVAIWNSPNKGGIGIAKKAFLQAAAIKLSGSSVSATATVWAQVAIVESYLATLPKLTPANVQSFNTVAGASNASAAAGAISAWIDANHCE